MPGPRTARPEADASAGAGAVIGTEGGEVVFEEDGVRVRVSVPSGALETARRLKIRPHGGAVGGAVGPVVELGPDGTRFAKPVTVFMSQPAPVQGEAIVNTLQVATLRADGWEALTPAAAGSGEVAGQTEHFSVFGLIASPEGNLSVLGESSGQSFEAGPVSLRSSEAVRLSSMAVASTFVSFGLSAPEARTVELTVGGLKPQVEVFLYEPPSLLPTRWSANAGGEVVFSTDLGPAPRTFWLQAAQGTIKIDGAFPDGGDCALVGVFDPVTSTCTLTSDVANNLELNSAGLTLDCAGHTIAPTAAVPAVRLSFNDSAVTGCRVEASATGVLVNFGVSGARIVNNTIVNHANAAPAVHLNVAGFNAVVEGNTIEAAEGIFLQESGGATISNNRIQATVAIRGLSSLTAFNLIDHNTLVNVDFPGAGFLRGVHLEAAAWNTVADNALDGRSVGQRLDLAGISIAQIGYSTLVGNTIEGYDKGIVLGATGGMEVAFNRLSDNATALAITAVIPPWDSPPRITFNDFVRNGPPQLTSASDLDLTDSLDVPGSPTFGKGNYWGHDCAAPSLFVPGLDANTTSSGAPVAVADSNPFGAPVAHLDRTDTAALAALLPPACPDPTNHPPVLAQPFAPLDVDEDALPTSLVLTEHLTDSDPTDQLTFVAASSQPNILQAEVVGTTLTLTPLPDQHGTADVLIRATDLAGAHTEALLTVTLHPVNDAPTLPLPVPPLTLAEDAPTTTLDLTDRAHDVDVATDADLLTWHLIANSAPLLIRAEIIADALHLTPEPDQHGLATLTLRVTDLAGLAADLDVQITVEPVNDPPRLVEPLPPVEVEEDADPVTIDLDASFEDPHGDPLLYAVVTTTPPDLLRATLEGSLLTLDFAPDQHGTAQLTLRASDPDGAPVQAVLTVVLTPVNDPPVVRPQTLTTLGADPVPIRIEAFDVDDDDCELTFRLLDAPTHGQLSPLVDQPCAPGGDTATTLYQADPAFTGLDHFTVQVSDGRSTSEPATLTVFVEGNVEAFFKPTLPEGFEPGQHRLPGGQGETLEGLEGLDATLTRIEAVVEGTCGEGATAQVKVVMDQPRDVLLMSSLQDQQPRPLGGLSVPTGCIKQVRLHLEDLTLSLRGQRHTVKIPSGDPTGLKIILPGDGVEVRPGHQVALTITFDPFDALIRNRQGFSLRPTLTGLTQTLTDQDSARLAMVDIWTLPGYEHLEPAPELLAAMRRRSDVQAPQELIDTQEAHEASWLELAATLSALGWGEPELEALEQRVRFGAYAQAGWFNPGIPDCRQCGLAECPASCFPFILVPMPAGPFTVFVPPESDLEWAPACPLADPDTPRFQQRQTAEPIFANAYQLRPGQRYTFRLNGLSPGAEPVMRLVHADTRREVTTCTRHRTPPNDPLQGRTFTLECDMPRVIGANSPEHWLVVHGFVDAAAGSANLTLNAVADWRWTPRAGGNPIAFGGVQATFCDLESGEDLVTVYEPAGGDPHQLLVIEGRPDGELFAMPMPLDLDQPGLHNAVGHRLRRGSPHLRHATVIWSSMPNSAVSFARNDRQDDTDDDGLGDALELELGTCPSRGDFEVDGWSCDLHLPQDTDNDGLDDAWEVLGAGSPDGPDQPLRWWGADPRHKDVFVEVDYGDDTDIADPLNIATVISKFGDPMVRRLQEFYNEPGNDLVNPDGQPGLRLHLDVEGSPAVVGSLPIHPVQNPVIRFDGGGSGVAAGTCNGTAHRERAVDSMVASRRGIFRYACLSAAGGGVASRPGTSYRAFENATENIHSHESGHLWGLGHGGLDRFNGKPQYQSRMNYGYNDLVALLAVNGSAFSPGRYTEVELNPMDLDESLGVQPGPVSLVDLTSSWLFDTRGDAVDFDRDGNFNNPRATAVVTWSTADNTFAFRVHRQTLASAQPVLGTPSITVLGPYPPQFPEPVIYIFYAVNDPVAGNVISYRFATLPEGQCDNELSSYRGTCSTFSSAKDTGLPGEAVAAAWVAGDEVEPELVVVGQDGGVLTAHRRPLASQAFIDPRILSQTARGEPDMVVHQDQVHAVWRQGNGLGGPEAIWWARRPLDSPVWGAPEPTTLRSLASPTLAINLQDGRLYMLITDAAQQLVMASWDANGGWRLEGPGGYQLNGAYTTAHKPALAWQPSDVFDPSGSGAWAIVRRNAGNDLSRRLFFRRFPTPLEVTGPFDSRVMIGGPVLRRDPRLLHLQGALVDLADGSQVSYLPYAGGVYDYDLRDTNDFALMSAGICVGLRGERCALPLPGDHGDDVDEDSCEF